MPVLTTIITHNPSACLPDTLPSICSNSARLGFLYDSCPSYNETNIDYGHILCDDANHMLFCDAPKTGTSFFKRLWLNYTRDVAGTQVHDKDFLNEHGLRYLHSYSEAEIEIRLRTYFKFLTVRHPLVRILSVYRNKLESPNKYYHEHLGRTIEHVIGGVPMEDTTGDYVTFKQFVTYLVGGSPHEYEHHMRPVTYLCYPCEIHYDFIVRLETSYADYLQVFYKLRNARDAKQYLLESMLYVKAETDKQRVIRYYSQLPAELINSLQEKYHADMTFFGYTWDNTSLTYGCELKRNGKECC